MKLVRTNRRRLPATTGEAPMTRVVHCSNCTGRIAHGTSQVFSKLLFHFCSKCWMSKREECNAFMQKFAPKEAA